jgi:septum formation protein
MNAKITQKPLNLVLASGSPYRRKLLDRLGIPFNYESPDVPEDRRSGEEPGELSTRLAQLKATAIAASYPGSIVIGSDQVAVRDGEVLGKPGTASEAVAQLSASSGRAVEFLTGVCVLGGEKRADEPFLHVDITRVAFRRLSDEEVRRYVERERPLDCAGSFKAEALGISLFERIDSNDPTGLIGLPLIWLAGVLRHLGFGIP